MSGDAAIIAGVVAPIFTLLFLGWWLGRIGFFSQDAGKHLIRYVWYIGIPSLLVSSLAKSPLPSVDEVALVGGYYAALFSVYALVYLGIGRFFGLTAPERAVMSLAACFANIGFVGIPVTQAVLGDEGLQLVLILLSFHSLTLLPVTSLLVARARGGGEGSKAMLAASFETLKQNPVLIALVIGIGWSASGIAFPDLITKILKLPATSAAPVGLFAAGLALSTVKLDGDLWQAACSALIKLLLVPLAVWTALRHGIGVPDLWVQVGTLLASLPIGMIAYSFALELGVAPRRNASAVLISTVLSVVTLSTVLVLIRANAL